MTIPQSAQRQGTAAPGPKEARDVPIRVFIRVKAQPEGPQKKKENCAWATVLPKNYSSR